MKTGSIYKKSIRSVRRNKGSFFACVIVLSLGILAYISMASILDQIQNGIQSYYDQYYFADVFAEVGGMPENQLRKLMDVKGVESVEGVLSATFKVDMAEPQEIIKVKLIGIDPEENRTLNQYKYVGEMLKYNNDIWLGKAFYSAYGLKNGDDLSLLVNGSYMDFGVKGTMESPEFITILPESAVFPDEKAYTVGLIQHSTLEQYTGMAGFVTDISLKLEADTTFNDVEQSLQEILSQYGLEKLNRRADQTSHQYIMDEIGQIEAMATLLPAIFLLVTFIMIYIMLKRMIEQERGEIGTYKAFGYKDSQIAAGYLIYGGTVSLFGFFFGVLLSYPFGVQLYRVYSTMYSLPEPDYIVSGAICAKALLLSFLVSLISVLSGSKSILKIRPAEAMRAASPEMKTGGVSGRWGLHRKIFNQAGIMAVRNMLRNKKRSALIIFSIFIAFGLTSALFSVMDYTARVLNEQTEVVEVYDIKATLDTPRPLNQIVNEINRLEGVVNTEGLLVLPVQLIHNNFREDLAAYGMDSGGDLLRIRGTSGEYYQAPENGILLSQKLADKLNLEPNDILEIQSPYLKENISVCLVDIIEETMGPGCYMDLSFLSGLFYDTLSANTLLIKADRSVWTAIQEKLAQYPYISDIANKERIITGNQAMLDSFMTMMYALVIMAFLMGFGAIYNISRISMAEKKRELATLRILGYRVEETAAINGLEQWMMLWTGAVLGFIPANLLKELIQAVFSTDYFILHISITPLSALMALICCMMAVVLSNMAAKHEIKKYTLVEVLRERE